MPNSTGSIARVAYQRVKAARIRLEPLLKRAGLTRAQLDDPRIRLPVGAQIEFLNAAAAALDDDLLGFHLAQIPDFRGLGLYYYVVATSATLADVFERVALYSTIANEGVAQPNLRGREIGTELRFSGIRRHLDCHMAEFLITALLRTCRQLTGRHLIPKRARFAHQRHGGMREMAEYFGVDIEFGADRDEIAFERSSGDLPLRTADPFLNKLLVTYCEEVLAHRARQRGPFQTEVQNAIMPLLPLAKPRAGEVARQLGLSPRTFARRLANEDVSFSEVLENLRRDLARRHLEDGELPISQIAWLLGYKEVGAFSHAFRRWTGKAPRQVRTAR